MPIRVLILALLVSTGWCNLSFARAWQPYNGHLSRMAKSAGYDTDGKQLFVCRARFKGSLQPGKTWRGYGKCNIAYGGKEYIRSRFQVLLGHSTWRPVSSRYTFKAGRDTDGKTLYICRAPYRNSLQLGKTWQGYNKCNVSYGGKELLLSRYTVLAHQKSVTPRVIIEDNRRIHRRRQCVSDNFGKQSCGYNCVKTPFKVACARTPRENCVSNAFYDVRCGHHCRVDTFNKIHCD